MLTTLDPVVEGVHVNETLALLQGAGEAGIATVAPVRDFIVVPLTTSSSTLVVELHRNTDVVLSTFVTVNWLDATPVQTGTF